RSKTRSTRPTTNKSIDDWISCMSVASLSIGRAARIEDWLARRRFLIVGAIFLFSVLIRVVYFVQISSGPCLWQNRWNQTDMAFFDEWARTISTGDLLVNRPMIPNHAWHDEVANAFARDFPDRVPEIEARVGRDGITSFTQAVWRRWLGDKTFY